MARAHERERRRAVEIRATGPGDREVRKRVACRCGEVHRDGAERVDDLAERVEVDLDVVVDGHVEVVRQRVDHALWSVVEGCVDLRLAPTRDVDPEVAGERHEEGATRIGVRVENHDGVGALTARVGRVTERLLVARVLDEVASVGTDDQVVRAASTGWVGEGQVDALGRREACPRRAGSRAPSRRRPTSPRGRTTGRVGSRTTQGASRAPLEGTRRARGLGVSPALLPCPRFGRLDDHLLERVVVEARVLGLVDRAGEREVEPRAVDASAFPRSRRGRSTAHRRHRPRRCPSPPCPRARARHLRHRPQRRGVVEHLAVEQRRGRTARDRRPSTRVRRRRRGRSTRRARCCRSRSKYWWARAGVPGGVGSSISQ